MQLLPKPVTLDCNFSDELNSNTLQSRCNDTMIKYSSVLRRFRRPTNDILGDSLIFDGSLN